LTKFGLGSVSARQCIKYCQAESGSKREFDVGLNAKLLIKLLNKTDTYDSIRIQISKSKIVLKKEEWINDENIEKRGRNKRDVELAIEKFKVLYILGSCPIYELQKQIDADFLSNLPSLTKNFFY
jgi:hypothetical protein